MLQSRHFHQQPTALSQEAPWFLTQFCCIYGGAQPKSSNPDSPPAAFGTTWIDTRSSWGHLRRSMDRRTRTHGTMWHSAGWSLDLTFAMFFCVYLYGWHSWLVTHFCHSFSDHVQDLTRSCSGFHLLRDLVMATTTVCSLLVCPWIACPNPRRRLHLKKYNPDIIISRLYNLYIPYHKKYISENGYTDNIYLRMDIRIYHPIWGLDLKPFHFLETSHRTLRARCRTLGRSISSCSQLGNFSEEILKLL